MAQAQRSAVTRKPLTVKKSATVRRRIVAGHVSGVEMPSAERMAVMPDPDRDAPEAPQTQFAVDVEAAAAAPAALRQRLDGLLRAATAGAEAGAEIGAETGTRAIARSRARLAPLLALAFDPDARRKLLLGVAAVLLLVVSGGLAFAVFGERTTAQTAVAALPVAPALPAPPQDPNGVAAPSPVADGLAISAPAPSAGQGMHPEGDVVSQYAQAALAALRNPGAASMPPPAPDAVARMAENNRLYRMVAEAISQGQSEDYIDRMVNLAHQRGEITVPPALIKADGTVDTKTVVALFAGG